MFVVADELVWVTVATALKLHLRFGLAKVDLSENRNQCKLQGSGTGEQSFQSADIVDQLRSRIRWLRCPIIMFGMPSFIPMVVQRKGEGALRAVVCHAQEISGAQQSIKTTQ
jgi:hypothetical protein